MGFKRNSPKTEEEWLELRTKVLTATEMAVILGLNPYRSVAQLLAEKKTKLDLSNNAFVWMGQALEPVVVEATNKALGTNFELFDGRAFYCDPELGLGATQDAGDGTALLECKSTKPRNHYAWAYWPPAYYLCQLYIQLYCTSRQEGYLSILSTNLVQYTPELDLPIHVHKLLRSDRIDTIILTELERFWTAQAEGKNFRVNRKQATVLEILIRMNLESIL